MRYNANELKHMAVNSGRLCAKEGVLCLSEREGKIWKTEVLTERWCRLIDNLFFYFKSKERPEETGADPQGVFILEGSHVKEVPLQDCAFILEFDSDSRSTYFLASKPSEAREWIKALVGASYTELKKKYEMLKKQENTENIDLSSQPTRNIKETRSANSSPMLSHRKKIILNDHNASYSDLEGTSEVKITKKKKKKGNKGKILLPLDTVLPVLEIAISCVELNIPKTIDLKRPVQIRVYRVQSLNPPVVNMRHIFTTECVKSDASVEFTSCLTFYQSNLITPDTILRFQLCQIKEKGTIDTLGCADCIIGNFFHLSKPLQLLIKYQESHIGNLQLHVIREHVSAQLTKSSNENHLSMALLSSSTSDSSQGNMESNSGDIGRIPNLKSLYCQAISTSYKFPTENNENMSVQEIMLETRLSFQIPLMFLKLLIDQETRFIGTLNSINHLVKDCIQAKDHVRNKTSLIEQYQEAVKNTVQSSQEASFKLSVQKTEKKYEFAPTNLHLQRMIVRHLNANSKKSDTERESHKRLSGVYDILTTGAATAHCLKYKNGGLLSLIATKKERENPLSMVLDPNFREGDISELPAVLPHLHAEVQSLVSTLETLILAAQECNTLPNRTSTNTAVANLQSKTLAFVKLLDNKNLCGLIKSILNNTQNQNQTGNGMEDKWEGQKAAIKLKLVDIIKRIEDVIEIVDQEPLVEIENPTPLTSPMYGHILGDLKVLLLLLTNVMETAMQGYIAYLKTIQSPDSLELTYRRDVVFSQVLSACVCGVSTNILSSLHDTEHLKNVARHGILIQFESLLSTFKNELGMLEDYVVGVYDLQKVTFICEKAREQSGNDMDHLLPSLQGTRNNIIVKLHIHSDSFKKLPESMKNGVKFSVIPVIFNVGINEEQTLAGKIGTTALQENINTDCFARLQSYHEKLKTTSTKYNALGGLFNDLHGAVNSKKKKHVEILHFAAEICRCLNGIRVTSCKSAKDRTAMSVTLEQVQILEKHHGLPWGKFSDALNCMRSNGTRLQNTKKNVGVPKYAFTSVQLMTFPKLYKPPEGTFGKADT